MLPEILLRYLHFISIFTIAGTLAAEFLLIKKEMTRAELGRVARIDALYGIAAVILVAAGLTLWLGSIGKPAEFYTSNWIFSLKISLFVLIGLLSIYPTVFFIKQRKGKADETVLLPKAIFWMIRLELLLLFIIPFLAGLMAKGIGLAIENQ